MRILLVAATKTEIEPFILNNPDADILISGVGAAVSAVQIIRKLQQARYDFVIQAGIAGSFNRIIGLGEVVTVKKDCFADVGISEKNVFQDLFEIGLSNKDLFPFKNGWLENDTERWKKFSAVSPVTAITVNTITDSDQQNKQYQAHYQAHIESMEGASLHYACLLERIPFLQLRAISNYVGERDKSKWAFTESIQHLNNRVSEVLDELRDS